MYSNLVEFEGNGYGYEVTGGGGGVGDGERERSPGGRVFTNRSAVNYSTIIMNPPLEYLRKCNPKYTY